MSGDIFDTISELRASGRPFCVATVIRTADVTSAKAGAKAVITEDGEILGHLGGACVRRAILNVSSEVLTSGTPRVIQVKPSEKVVPMMGDDGVQVFKSGCPSGGTVDLLVEAFAPTPRIVVFGCGPTATAIAAHAALMPFQVFVEADNAMDCPAVFRFDPSDDGLPEVRATDFVVVASQGQNDLKALRKAIETPVGRIALVASRRKASALSKRLMGEGVPETEFDRVKAPAGLDIGGVDAHEIAISVLAEIIQLRNAVRREHPDSVVQSR